MKKGEKNEIFYNILSPEVVSIKGCLGTQCVVPCKNVLRLQEKDSWVSVFVLLSDNVDTIRPFIISQYCLLGEAAALQGLRQSEVIHITFYFIL